MKKTIHTLLTAAIFATANLSAMPVVAEDGSTAAGSPEIAKQMSLSESSEKEGNGDSEEADGLSYDILRATTKSVAPVYGPAPTTTVNTTALIDVTTTTVQPVYGTQPTTQLISTTSASNTTTTTLDPDKLIYLTTTTTMPLYGPAITAASMGDVNQDNSVDIFDMVALRRMLIQGYTGQNGSKYNADVNLDGKVNIADLVLLQNFLLGKIDKLNDAGTWAISPPTEVEQISTAPNDDIGTTTTTTIYSPISETIVTLYGIMPSRNARNQMINPNKTTETTAEQTQQTEEK